MEISNRDLDEIISNLLHETSKRKICPTKKLVETGIYLPLSRKLIDKHIKGCEICKGTFEKIWEGSDDINLYKKRMWQLVEIAGAVFGLVAYLSWDPKNYWDDRAFNSQTKESGG